MPENRVSATLYEGDLNEIMTAIDTLKQKMPFLVDLSKQDRVSMLKMGDKSRAFVQKMMEVVKQNQDFLPRSFDVDEMQKDVDLINQLYPIFLALQQFTDLLEDTVMVVGSEAYAAALVAYRYAKDADLGAGLEGVLDDIGRRFARKSGQSKAETPESSEQSQG